MTPTMAERRRCVQAVVAASFLLGCGASQAPAPSPSGSGSEPNAPARLSDVLQVRTDEASCEIRAGEPEPTFRCEATPGNAISPVDADGPCAQIGSAEIMSRPDERKFGQ